MAVQNVILVGGFNYENDKNPAFLQACNNRMALLLANSKNAADMVFTLFDVAAGVVKRSAVDTATKTRAWVTVQTFSPVTTANYRTFVVGNQNKFNQNPGGVMSITDVYDFVRGIGAGADRGTLVELSFFTHGWQGGPILVNSSDPTSNDPAQPRNPDDKDARHHKDFIAPTMDTTALASFKNAFAPSGIVWTWGCSFARAAHIVLSRLFKTTKFRSTPRGKIKDTDTFDLDFSVGRPTPTLDDFNGIVNTVLPGGRVHGDNYTVTKSFLDIKNSFKAIVANTYTAKIADATGAKVFGALPGTGADQEKGVKLPLMVVPTRKPPYDDDFRPTLTFYKTYLRVTLDPERRGYGTF